jgi:hypothetical protein
MNAEPCRSLVKGLTSHFYSAFPGPYYKLQVSYLVTSCYKQVTSVTSIYGEYFCTGSIKKWHTTWTREFLGQQIGFKTHHHDKKQKLTSAYSLSWSPTTLHDWARRLFHDRNFLSSVQTSCFSSQRPHLASSCVSQLAAPTACHILRASPQLHITFNWKSGAAISRKYNISSWKFCFKKE